MGDEQVQLTLQILGIPIANLIFCAKSVTQNVCSIDTQLIEGLVLI